MFNRKTPVTVLKSGLVVSKCYPLLGATPDARIIDPGCSVCFGLAEVKCPSTKFNVTPLVHAQIQISSWKKIVTHIVD
jgi:hypothetical protein